MQQPPNKNQHNNAAQTYGKNAKELSNNQRALEGQVLLKSNKRIQDIINNWDSVNKTTLEDTLKYNRKIWMVFYDTAREHKEAQQTDELRTNITKLADFIFKREIDILSDPQKNKLDILMNINSQIAAGLMTSTQQ